MVDQSKYYQSSASADQLHGVDLKSSKCNQKTDHVWIKIMALILFKLLGLPLFEGLLLYINRVM